MFFLLQVRHVGLVEPGCYDTFKFRRTVKLQTMTLRSAGSQAAQEFSIQCEVATIADPM